MTAEFAVAVPAVLLVLAACLGGLRVATERLRLVDAAATAARAVSLGEAPERGAAGAAVAAVDRRGQTVCVTLRSEVPLLGLPVPVEASGCALAGIRP